MAIEIRKPQMGIARRLFPDWNRFDTGVDEMFGRLLRGFPRAETEAMTWSPAIDLVDKKDELTLRADLPGLAEKDIEVTLQDGALTIRGDRKEEKEEKKGEDYYYCERWSGAFSRTMTLPPGVNPDKVNATFKNGVLEVHLPKTKEAEGKKIEIKAA